ncbi:MAG: hypothetical protein Q8928_13800 [Bacteroidota bacterium]|nr:hypothetical protein [Bacteroidota bacterium]
MKKLNITLLITVLQLFLTYLGAQEQASLHTDRNIFIAGENLFFNLYIVDKQGSTSSSKSNFAYLVLRNVQNARIYGLRLKLNNGMASGSLYLPDTLSTGPYQLVAYTNYMRNAGEESFFTREIFVANRFDNEPGKLLSYALNDTANVFTPLSAAGNNLKLSFDKPRYHKREKISIDIDPSESGLKSLTNISISVHKTEPIETVQTNSGLADGKPESSECSYLPENKGTIVNGRLIDNDNQKGLPEKIIFLSTPDSIANLQFTQTDKEGKFQFLLNGYYTNKKLYFKAQDTQNAKIEIDDKYDIKTAFKPSVRYSITAMVNYLTNAKNVTTIQKNYRSDYKKELTARPSKIENPPTFYLKPYFTTYPADYVKLNDFVEISRELLFLSKIRKHSKMYIINMLDYNNKDFFSESPLIFLDGVPIDDINQIIPLNTDKINKIETVGESLYYGGLFFSGIMAVFSKKNELNNIHWQSTTLSLKAEPDYPASVFCPPDYSKDNKRLRIPDFRQLLYWEPNATLQLGEKKHIECYASDNTGEYTIDVKGVTADGTPVNASTTFTILSNSK